MDLKRVRYESIQTARKLGVEVLVTLPLLDPLLEMRSPDETVSRILAMNAIVAAAYGFDTHLHNLCRPFPTVSLSLAQRLVSERSGTQERISAQFHEQKYRQAAQRLEDTSLLPLAGDIAISQVVRANRRYRHLNCPGSGYPFLLFEDEILLFAWCGNRDGALTSLKGYTAEMRGWPAHVLSQLGHVEAWEDKMLKRIAGFEDLQRIAESQAAELNLNNLRTAELVC